MTSIAHAGPARRRVSLIGTLIAGAAIALGTLAADVDAAKPKQGPFVDFSLGTVPGTVCPGSGAGCSNIAAEPAIRGARDGSFYASSENGLGGGTLAWKSTRCPMPAPW